MSAANIIAALDRIPPTVEALLLGIAWILSTILIWRFLSTPVPAPRREPPPVDQLALVRLQRTARILAGIKPLHVLPRGAVPRAEATPHTSRRRTS